MNASKFEKATIAFERIKQLDKQIIEIEKLAMLLADGSTKQSISISIEDLSESEKGKILDEDGSLIGSESISGVSFWKVPYGSVLSIKEDNQNEHKLAEPTSEKVMLQILGVLLHEKINERNYLIKQLEKMDIVL
jgi:hypothetical protein